MKRLTRTFEKLAKEKRCGLVAYVTCGDPDLETTVKVVRALEGAGADAIELGVPFSDPIADGPVIQAASQRALSARHFDRYSADVLATARHIRERRGFPLIAFTYLNPAHAGTAWTRFADRRRRTRESTRSS
jgi:tryptophan synthase alpha chain